MMILWTGRIEFRRCTRVGRALIWLMGLPGTIGLLAAQSSMGVTSALKQMSLEELMELEVTSVSRRPEKLLEAAAAIQIITGEEIRRSGASSIPEALRLVTNLSTAQENAHEWVISSRGFSSDVGNKLLVLMDGRTVYTPLFSGVFWDRQDYVLEDIDRIEVISGPGGTLWGANAVNGVINITTRSARETQGIFAEAGGGDQLRRFASVRYGGTIARNVSYRIYGKYFDRDGEFRADGGDAMDSWLMRQGGFRIDAGSITDHALTLQGDIYGADEHLPTGGITNVSGGNLLGRWTRTFASDSDVSLQVYYDNTHLVLPVPAVALAPAGVFRDDLKTYDLDFQHRLWVGDRHQWVWGAGYRRTRDVVGNAPGLAFFPELLEQDRFSGFLQDEVILIPDRLKLAIGSKVEHNDYTGFEYEPGVRLQWFPSPGQMVWGAISRAVRMPSRIDREISQPSPQYFIVLLKGGAAFRSESVLAHELGYRAQLGSRVTASISTFFNNYDDVRSTTPSPPDPVFGLPFPFVFENNLEGETYGFELNARFQAREFWRLRGGYSLLRQDIRIKPGRVDFNNALNETSDPEQQFWLRSSIDLFKGLEFDAGYRWVDRRRVNNVGVAAFVPSHGELDVRLGWRATPEMELSVVGRNLLHHDHPEYGVPGPGQIEIGRSIFGKVSWRY